LLKTQLRQRSGAKKLDAYLASNPTWCQQLQQRIQTASAPAELLSLWQVEIQPHVMESVWIVLGSVSQASDYTMQLLRELIPLSGEEDARLLISGLSNRPGTEHESSQLLSLGPLSGLIKVANGEIERSEYLEMYGHRGPDEFELSQPRPAEDPHWLDRHLAQIEGSQVDVEAMLADQQAKFSAAWGRLQARHPQQAGKLKRRIQAVVPLSHRREAARSEYVRDRWLMRSLALRAGELLGLSAEQVFFLTLQELLEALAGDQYALEYIPARQQTHDRYETLPPYPSIIRGRFDAFQWAADPQHRSDIHDASGSIDSQNLDAGLNCVVTGAAASAGQVEGSVRRLDTAEQGEQLKIGEVLVTTQTDISWTLLFPRAAAIVTDVGAPLSHAAIVARELGIPAVVGCGNATMRLKTGERVRVDGSRGIVEILSTAGSS